MLAWLILAAVSLLGLTFALRIDARLGMWTRVGVGLALGQVVLLWMPFGLAAAFDLSARDAGLLTTASAGLAASVQLLASWRKSRGEPLKRLIAAAAAPAVRPLLMTGALLLGLLLWLHHTHYLLPRADGLHSAGVTWGDLPIHAALASRFLHADGLAALEHPLFAYGPLSYPFLPDYSVAVLAALGFPLRWAFIVGGMLPLVAFVLVLHGLSRVWNPRGGPLASAFALLLFFFAGGLGFTLVAVRVLQGVPLAELLATTNATYVDPVFLKSGHIGNLLIAARSASYGMAIGGCALLLMGHALERGAFARSLWLTAGVLAGSLPLIHGHSFLVFGGVALWYVAWLARPKLAATLWCLLPLGLLALPQVAWLSAQGGPSSLRFALGLLRPAPDLLAWLRDVVADLGMWLVLLPLGLRAASTRARRLATPLLLLLPLASVVTFTPTQYDNVKLLAWFDVAAALLGAGFLADLVDLRIASRPARGARLSAAAVLAIGCTLSGALAVAHEWVNDGFVMSYEDRAFADFVAEHTRPQDVIATAASYHDPVAMFSGRRVLIATPTMLGTHGIQPRARALALLALYRGDPSAPALIRELGVDAVVVGPREHAEVRVIDERFLRAHARAVLQQGERRLYLLGSAAAPAQGALSAEGSYGSAP